MYTFSMKQLFKKGFSTMNTDRKNKILFTFMLIAMFAFLIFLFWEDEKERAEQLTYDQAITYIKNREVVSVEATNGSDKVIMTLEEGERKTTVIPNLEEFSTIILQENESGAQIELKIKESLKGWGELTSTILYLVIIGNLFRMTSGIGGNEAIKNVSSEVRFQDVAGIEEEKGQLIEVANFLKEPQRYLEMGAKIPKGVLLFGEPGTGKTLLAKAIAGEAGVPFFQVSASSFEEKFVGVGASRVRKLFREAKKHAPCIIFIDEIDAVAQKRYSAKSYSEQTLNQILAEMDGFNSNDKIIVLAATNHKEVLDSAIIRPGRFDRSVFIPKPDVRGREDILAIYAKNKKLESDVSLHEIAKKTIGFTGADLANILNEAAIFAVNQGKKTISISDVDEAIARVLVGLEKKQAVISEEDKRLTAIHESGHAIVSAVMRPNVKNQGISIIQRGSAGGYNQFGEVDTKYMRKTEIKKQISVMYGGRAAEEVLLGDISSGATSDLENASKLAYLMVTRFAMSEQLMVKIGTEGSYNEQLDSQGIARAESICTEAYDKARQVVKAQEGLIRKLSELLCEKEYLSQEEIDSFLQENLK